MATILVGGSQRTGTNLMQTILCQDVATNRLIHECQFLTNLLANYAWAKHKFKANTSHYFESLRHLCTFHRDIVHQLLDSVRRLHDEPETLVLKHPELTPYFNDVLELIDDCLFVCMVRDPRDAIASKLRVLENQRRLNGKHIDGTGDRRISVHCRQFHSYYAPLFGDGKENLSSRLYFVRYEDLVTRPGSVLSHLRKFTGLALENIALESDFDTGAINYDEAGTDWRPWISPHYGKAVTASRVGRFHDILTAGETELIAENCSRFMRQFGYN